jgi:hypothetical protein
MPIAALGTARLQKKATKVGVGLRAAPSPIESEEISFCITAGKCLTIIEPGVGS